MRENKMHPYEVYCVHLIISFHFFYSKITKRKVWERERNRVRKRDRVRVRERERERKREREREREREID